MNKRVAVLKDNKLVDAIELDGDLPPNAIDVDPGDLPLDGSYKWDGEAFVPLGFGFGRVETQPPVNLSLVIHQIVRHLGRDLPSEAREWADWYERNLQVRDEEAARVKGKR